ncbi:MAG: aconitate hydratase AcnA [Rhodospirillaceae bacterium]
MASPTDFEATLSVAGEQVLYYSLEKAEAAGFGAFNRLPKSLKVLGENLLRNCDKPAVSEDDIRCLGRWTSDPTMIREVAYHPVRILMPEISGIPLLVDLSAMRDAVHEFGGDPKKINPRLPIDLVVDHSVNVDHHGSADALRKNMALEFQRNSERYRFVKWAQQTYENISVVPPGMGILHQVNLEHIARIVWSDKDGGRRRAYPDAMLGMDSHTPMINALSVFGWGVGGLEAGAAMLGQAVSMLIPNVVGVRVIGQLPEGTTTTDAVLTVTERLRAHGVVGKFVEYFGPGLDNLALTDRATLSNMSPEYGATMGFFPIDDQTLAFLEMTGRDADQVALVEAYAKEQGLWRDAEAPVFTETVDIDLSEVEPCLAGPFRPNQRTSLSQVPQSYHDAMVDMGRAAQVGQAAKNAQELSNGAVVLAAITSCTNTSNPAVMIGAGILARNAVRRGLSAKPWVKTSLSPGSVVVADYLKKSGLQDDLDALGFHVTGFGCMSCVGLSGPLPEPITDTIQNHDLTVAAVLSGNRNFEGRVHALCRVNYLASPMLVVAYALAGHLTCNMRSEALGVDADGQPVFLKDIWPTSKEIAAAIHSAVSPDLYLTRYATAKNGDANWQALPASESTLFEWQECSTYIQRPPLFDGFKSAPGDIADIRGARALAIFGDMTTTDHISPVGTIPADVPAGKYLQELGVAPEDFNIYGARRTNHEVMIRGTFANIRLRNEMVPGIEGGYTVHQPSGDVLTIYDAAMRYAARQTPLVVIGGDAYGTGSSRDWAAKGTKFLGIRAVVAEGLERIHRSNLIGMGVLPLQFPPGVSRKTLSLDGSETFDLTGLEGSIEPQMTVKMTITRSDRSIDVVDLICRLDTDVEIAYYRHGGMLHYCLRDALASA